MVISMAVNSKSDSRREDLSLRDKILSQQWLVKVKCRNIQSIMSECLILIALAKILVGKNAISAGPIQDFCNTPPPITDQQLKQCQRTKTNKIMLSAFHSLVFRTKLTISLLKSKQVFHPNNNCTQIASIGVESSTRIA